MNNFTNPEVEMSDSQVKLIKEIIGKDKLVVEIGCYAGKNTVSMAEHNKVIAIDPFICEDKNDKCFGDLSNIKDIFMQRIENNKNIYYCDAKSIDRVGIFRNFDVLVIDGEHTRDGFVNDLMWLRYLAKDGIVIFHDYGIGVYPYIKEYVDKLRMGELRIDFDEIASDFDEIARDGSLIILKRIR